MLRRRWYAGGVAAALSGALVFVGLGPAVADVTPTPSPEATAQTQDATPAPDAATTETTAPAETDPTAASATTDAPAQPALRWRVVDGDGAVVAGTTLRLQGPRDDTVKDDGADKQWTASFSSVVEDNVGQPDYAGLDSDPEPGTFLVTHFVDEADATLTHDVVDALAYRGKPEIADGYVVGDAAGWTDLAGAVVSGPEREPVQITLLPAAPASKSDGLVESQAREGARGFAPLATSPTPLRCDAGYVYGVTAAGQLRQVAPDGTVTNLGTPASGVLSFNGLGVGPGGSPVYAIERTGADTSRNATVYEYTTTTGTWSSTGASTSALGGNTGTNMVGGAVNLSTGRYYFGGFTRGGDFKVYEYDPAATPRIKLKGTVRTTATSSSNGDMAFNANGDLFIVRGEGNSTEVYSVTAANFAAATGGTMTASLSTALATMSNVNGVAFDSSGRGFLGSLIELRSYAMPNWSALATVVSSGLNTTDLASCSSPATITIEKFVQGARVNASDQFTLSLTQGSTVLGTTTTTGNVSGVQDQRVGPQPTVRGVTLNFSEAAAGTTNLSTYASSWSCTVDGEPMLGASGTGTTGSVTIPSSGDLINCRFTNAPLVANVKVSKSMLDAFGLNPQPKQGWTVGASTVATQGKVASVPGGATQQTNAQGDAAWRLNFGTVASRATVTVAETQQAGYQFVSGNCVISSLNGTVREVSLTSEAGTSLTGIAPGDSVVCGYVNKPIPSTLTLTKNVAARDGVNDQFTLSAWKGNTTSPTTQVGSSVTTTGTATGVQTAKVGPEIVLTGTAGGPYWIREEASGFTNFNNYVTTYACVDKTPGSTWAGVSGTLTVTGGTAQASIGTIPDPAPGAVRAIECTITNAAKPKIVLKKDVELRRNAPADQFLMQITDASGSTVQAAATTTGTATGVQSVSAGPYIVNPGTEYRVREVLAATPSATAMPGYASSLECQWPDGTVVVSVASFSPSDNRSTSVGTIPTNRAGQTMTCTYVNTPLQVPVTVKKIEVDEDGANATPGSGWTVGMTVTRQGSAGSAPSQSPAGTTQVTDGNGAADWIVTLGGKGSQAQLAVNETQKPGFTFASGSCVVTHLNGTTTTFTFASAAGGNVTPVIPGDQKVDCTFTNRKLTGSVEWQKVDDSGTPQALAGSEWKIVGPAPSTTALAVVDCIGPNQPSDAACNTDTDQRAGYFKVESLHWGSYQLIETKAPAGHYPNPNAFAFTIDAEHLRVEVGSISNSRIAGPPLPLTGGVGSDIFTIVGGGALAFGLGYALYVQFRKRRREVS